MGVGLFCAFSLSRNTKSETPFVALNRIFSKGP